MRFTYSISDFYNYKRGQWEMSSVTLSLILQWLSSVVALVQLSAVMLEAGWTDSPAQGGMYRLMEWLGSQGSWTDITLTPCHDAESGREENNNSAKCFLFGQVALGEKANFRNKMTFTGKSIYCDGGRRWYFKSHLSLLTFNWMTDFYMLCIFAQFAR